MLFFASSNLIAISIIAYLCFIVPSVSGKIRKDVTSLSRHRTDLSQTKPSKPAHVPKPTQNHHNASTTTRPRAARRTTNRNKGAQKSATRGKNATKARLGESKTRSRWPTPTKQRREDDKPTPEPTGKASASTTVYALGANSFALLLPLHPGELVSDAEVDGIAYCTEGSGCGNAFPNGLITGAAYQAADDGSYVQITGCMDASQFTFAEDDDGGQFDNRFPNGAQCTFGGYEASFIELVEPSANRFCLRCCKSGGDQQNCNSHQDREGCLVAIPGTYDFGTVSCS